MSMRSILRLVVLGLAAVILFADSIPSVAAQEEEAYIQGWCSGYFSCRGSGCEGNDGWDWWPRTVAHHTLLLRRQMHRIRLADVPVLLVADWERAGVKE